MSVVALDGMGGDNAPAVTVEGALLAARRGVEVVIVGDRAVIEPALAASGAPAAVHVVHAPDAIGMADHDALEARSRRQSSIYIGVDLVKRGEASAFVSMGNTGAVLATAFVVLGRIRGVERPALGGLLPSAGRPTLMLDVGANADARPSHLVDFAYMGAAYVRHVRGVERPTVALLNIGEEPTKGSSLTVEAHAALAAASDLHFAGNIEGRHLLAGLADVVVTDGFTGNVAIKLMEGTVTQLFREIRGATDSPTGRLGGMLLRGAFRRIAQRVDYRSLGAAPLLGLNGLVMVGHGRSDGHAVANALVAASNASAVGLVEAMQAAARTG